jgi:F-type H+-transporting ATPase subunit a
MHGLRRIVAFIVLFGLAGMVFGAQAPVAPEAPAAPDAAHAAPGAAGNHAAGAHHGLPQAAVPLVNIGPLPVTNSMVVTWVVALGLIVFARHALRQVQDVPSGAQNFWEWLVESLHGFLEGIIGPDLVKRTFWFFATIFIFILFCNWFGLIPGVGTVGFHVQYADGHSEWKPLLRGANADLNMTFGMAMIFFALWLVWALQFNGPKGFILHLFGPKGDMTGWLKVLMIFVFILVGFLELVTILFRPVTLSFRLYGNIFAGENMLETMMSLVQEPAWLRAVASVLVPIPFYFLELMVGLVQALVFMLLTAVFTMLICTHEEGHGQEKAP